MLNPQLMVGKPQTNEVPSKPLTCRCGRPACAPAGPCHSTCPQPRWHPRAWQMPQFPSPCSARRRPWQCLHAQPRLRACRYRSVGAGAGADVVRLVAGKREQGCTQSLPEVSGGSGRRILSCALFGHRTPLLPDQNPPSSQACCGHGDCCNQAALQALQITAQGAPGQVFQLLPREAEGQAVNHHLRARLQQENGGQGRGVMVAAQEARTRRSGPRAPDARNGCSQACMPAG